MFRSVIARPLYAAVRPASMRAVTRPVIVTRHYHEKVISHYERPRNVRCLTFSVGAHLLSDNIPLFSRLALFPRMI